MKYILFFITVILFQLTANSQIRMPQERIVIIANLSENSAKAVDYDLSKLAIESKIKRILDLDNQKIELINPKIFKEDVKGWFLEYEFKTPTYAGLYKEELQIKNGQLVITESRNAQIGLATNCNTVAFTNDQNRCECIEKENPALDSQVTYRLFTSTR
jgi:hypothetical protein